MATKLDNWCGLCIGDDASILYRGTTRIVAFQSAGRTSDFTTWTMQIANHMIPTGALIGIFTETRIYGVAS